MPDQYDVIGDIHGHADKLKELLHLLGYTITEGCYRHPSRIAIFLGDFIDRGPQQREVLQTVMPMVKHGAAKAVMGNHELNALAYHTENPDKSGTWLRPRDNKNTHQHLAFLQEYLGAKQKSELKDVLDFFRSLPLWLDLPGIRVVHACWADNYIETLKPFINSDNTIKDTLLLTYSNNDGAAYDAVEALLKGVEHRLPKGRSFKDKDGNLRHEVRTRWWLNMDCTWGDITIPAGLLDEEAAALPFVANNFVGYPSDEKPVFLGHYWFNGHPEKLTDNVACLDYSVASNGKLVAYQWDGEKILDNNKFIYVE